MKTKIYYWGIWKTIDVDDDELDCIIEQLNGESLE